MAVVRKVQSKVIPSTPREETIKAPQKAEVTAKATEEGKKEEVSRKEGVRAKRVCAYCTGKIEPHYWDIVTLRRFLSDRGRIHARTRTGACAKHQRRITREIKRARHLAMLPFTVSV